MRRLLAATVVTTVLLAGAGCSADRDPPGTAAPTAPPSVASTGSGGAASPGAGSGAAVGNAPEVCAAAQQASSTAVRTYVEQLGVMIGAVGASDSKAAETARRQAEAALAGWRTALTRESGRATDPQLKTLLADLAAEVGTLGTDVDSIDETELDRLQQRLDQLCAR